MDRRQFISSMAASAATLVPPINVSAQGKLWPASGNLEHGDLIWMKRKDLIVPMAPHIPLEVRQKVAEELGSAKGRWSPEMIAQIMPKKRKKRLGVVLDYAQNYISVGHIAIVKKTRGRTEIIEAAGEDPDDPKNIKEHITKTPLSAWIKSCEVDDQFWIGSFSNFGKTEIDKVVALAEAQVAKKRVTTHPGRVTLS